MLAECWLSGGDGFGSTGMHTMLRMNEKKTTRTNEDMKPTNEEQTG